MNEFENILIEDDTVAPLPPHWQPRRKPEIPRIKLSEIAPADRQYLDSYLKMLVGSGGYRHGRYVPFHQFAAEMRQLEQHAADELARVLVECRKRGLPIAPEFEDGSPVVGRARSLAARLVLIVPEFGAVPRNMTWLLPDECVSEDTRGNVHDHFRRLKLEGVSSFRTRGSSHGSEGDEHE